MANLVPLHIDKDTGELVATRNPGSGSGGGPPAFGGRGEGHLHIQNIASSVWSILHAQATDLLLVQVYTTAGDLIIPDEISIVDINTVEVTLGSPTTGRAHIIFFEQA